MTAIDKFLFLGLPYVATVIFLVGAVYRYRTNAFSYSSLSSQFLEGSGVYVFAVLFHWGILMVFLAHLIAFLLPGATLAWYNGPSRLIASESVMVAFGLCALVGMVGLFVRRFTHPRVRVVTSTMDIVVEIVLLAQMVLGVWTALGYRWGYYWFAADLSPYLWSIVTLDPDIDAVAMMPWPIKAHVVGAFLIVGLVPFTRLAHFLVAPLHYIGRPYQRAIWNWDRTRVRDPLGAWSETAPRNN